MRPQERERAYTLVRGQIQAGIPIEKAREIVKLIKGEKFKAQAAIQGEEVRISSAKIDVLQEVMAFLKGKDLGIHMSFTNYR